MLNTEPLESNAEVSIWLILKAFGAVLFIPADAHCVSHEVDMSAAYDADMDAPEMVLERVVTLRNTITNETFKVRVLREMHDRYVVGSTKKDQRWIVPLMKAQWEITTLSPAARAAITILLCGAVVAIAALAIFYANK